jgi:hypothetical protein
MRAFTRHKERAYIEDCLHEGSSSATAALLAEPVNVEPIPESWLAGAAAYRPIGGRGISIPTSCAATWSVRSSDAAPREAQKTYPGVGLDVAGESETAI